MLQAQIPHFVTCSFRFLSASIAIVLRFLNSVLPVARHSYGASATEALGVIHLGTHGIELGLVVPQQLCRAGILCDPTLVHDEDFVKVDLRYVNSSLMISP
jgi:hypothetical protein